MDKARRLNISTVTDASIHAAVAAIKKQGPCAMCGVPGEYAAHRLIDSEIGAFFAGESLQNVVDDFHKNGSTTEMLSRWIAISVIRMEQESEHNNG